MRTVNPTKYPARYISPRYLIPRSLLTLLFGLAVCALLTTIEPEIVVPSVVAASPDLAGYAQAGTDGSTANSSRILTRQLTVVAGLKGVQFRADSPNATSRIIPSGSILRATGRSEDGEWLYVTVNEVTGDDDVTGDDEAAGDGETAVDEEMGWIATAEVIAFGIDAIPVREGANGARIDSAISSEEASGTVSEMSNSAEEPTADSADSSVSSAEPEDAAATADSASPSRNPDAAASAATSAPTNSTPTTSADRNTQEAGVIEVSVAESLSVTTSRLNVRSGPGVQYGVTTQVVEGDRLALIGRSPDGNWTQVVLPNTSGGANAENIGWVSSSFIEVGGDSGAAAGESMANSASTTNAGNTNAGNTNAGASVGNISAGAAGINGILVFQQSIGGQIYAYNLSSGALWPLTTGAEPAISPDRSTVAFTRTDGLYLIDIDGSNERLIFSGREGLGSPKWSPDGATIIFTRSDEWQACQKFGGRERCTESNRVGEGKYKKIMYAIAAVEADGSDYRDVVSTKPARAPDWTSAGIVYQSIDGLQLTSADRDAVNSLIDYDYLDPFYYDPDRQPNGDQIVFESNEGSHWQIFTINADGSGRRALTRPRTALVDQLPSSVAPAFSPDGQRIVYISNITSSGEAGNWKLWVMNADGSNQRQLPINLSLEYTFGVEQVVSWQ